MISDFKHEHASKLGYYEILNECESDSDDGNEVQMIIQEMKVLEIKEEPIEIKIKKEEEPIKLIETKKEIQQIVEEVKEEEIVEEVEEEVQEEEEIVEEAKKEEEEKQYVQEEEEEEFFEIEIDDTVYCTNNEENGLIYELSSDGELGEKIGYFKDGEPIFYADEQ
jgi:hypothetical protein